MAKQNTPKVITKKHIARLERERRQIRLIRGIAIAGILIVAGLLAFGYLRLNVFTLRLSLLDLRRSAKRFDHAAQSFLGLLDHGLERRILHDLKHGARVGHGHGDAAPPSLLNDDVAWK